MQHIPSLTYSEAKCRRDTGFIVDGLVKDPKDGGRAESHLLQTAYYSGAVSGQETQTADAINYSNNWCGSCKQDSICRQ